MNQLDPDAARACIRDTLSVIISTIESQGGEPPTWDIDTIAGISVRGAERQLQHLGEYDQAKLFTKAWQFALRCMSISFDWAEMTREVREVVENNLWGKWKSYADDVVQEALIKTLLNYDPDKEKNPAKPGLSYAIGTAINLCKNVARDPHGHMSNLEDMQGAEPIDTQPGPDEETDIRLLRRKLVEDIDDWLATRPAREAAAFTAYTAYDCPADVCGMIVFGDHEPNGGYDHAWRNKLKNMKESLKKHLTDRGWDKEGLTV